MRVRLDRVLMGGRIIDFRVVLSRRRHVPLPLAPDVLLPSYVLRAR
jgi:hypothetical protein